MKINFSILFFVLAFPVLGRDFTIQIYNGATVAVTNTGQEIHFTEYYSDYSIYASHTIPHDTFILQPGQVISIPFSLPTWQFYGNVTALGSLNNVLWGGAGQVTESANQIFVAWYGSSNPNLVYTNYTITLSNTSPANSAAAHWYYQGPGDSVEAMVKNVVLVPGQSDSWTTPPLKVSPAPADTFIFQAFLSDILPSLGSDAAGQILFTNPVIQGGLSGAAGSPSNDGGSFSRNTNTVSGGTSALNPNTNSIIWAAATGSASESTLRSGFSTVHQDLQNILAGQSIQNNNLLAITNALGNVEIYTRSNSDAMFQLVGVMTNLASVLTNQTAGSLTLTNYATETTLSNFLVALTSTNGLNDTNDYALDFGSFLDTNTPLQYSIEPTNVVVESDVHTNFSDIDSDSYNSGIKNGEDMWTDFISSLTPADIEEDFGDPDMTYTFPSFSGVHFSKVGTSGMTIDFNPMHDAAVASLFGFAKQLFIYLLALLYLARCANDSVKAVEIMENARGMDVSAQPITKKTYY